MSYVTNASATTQAVTPAGAATAETTSKQLLADNRNRIVAYVSNDGEKVAYLALGAKAEAHKGITLAPEDPTLPITGYTGEISVITAEGETVVTVAEA